jgi:F0F1-type ATP synthase epsilon subunit
VTILADDAVAAEEITPEVFNEEILKFEMLRDASTDDMKRSQYSASISRLKELKASLELKS